MKNLLAANDADRFPDDIADLAPDNIAQGNVIRPASNCRFVPYQVLLGKVFDFDYWFHLDDVRKLSFRSPENKESSDK